MGKLFTLLLIAISFSGFGQVYQTFNAYGWEVNRIKINGGLTLPTYAGLPSIGTVSNSSVNLRGALIYNTNDSTIYGWSGTQWRAIGSGGGGSYTAAFGMALSGSAFRVDSTVMTSQARTTAGLALKQPIEDQRLSTTNSPIFNRVILSNTVNTDAVQMSFLNTTYNTMTFFQDGTSFAQLAAIGDNAGLGARSGNFEFNLNRKKSIAFQVKSIEQFRIDSGNVALPQGALTMGSSIIVFGNSIPNGVGATVSDSSYVKVIDSLKRYSSTNNASNGSCIGDQAGVIFSEVTAPTNQYIYDLSVNDYRLHTSANHYTYYKYGLMDEVAWLGLRDSSKIRASGTSVTYSGTWTTPGAYGGLTKASSTVSSTATMTLKGSTILVSTINQNGNTGGFTISVDGSVMYTWSRPATNIVSVNGATFAPYLIPITGLYDSMHTVVITVTSITGGDAVYFNWAAGTSGHQSSQFEPSVYVNDASRQTSAGYATNGGSDALCAAYNAIIYDAVDFLASIGVNCVQVRGGSALNPLTDLSDGIHPNDRGHRIEAYSYINKMNGITYPKDRQRAGGSYTNGAINYNSNSLGFGTNGQVLTSGGSGVVPTWTTVSGWSLTGNAGTTAGTNFIGTTDFVDLVFKWGGQEAGRIGGLNTSFGNLSALNMASGTENTAFGHSTLQENTSGNYNTALGYDAIASNTTGSRNVGIGHNSLLSAVATSDNTGIGYRTLGQLSTGNSNIGIGSYAGYRTNTQSNKLYINNQDRTTAAGDSTLSLVYGVMAATIADQKLRVNGFLQVNDGTQGAGKVFTSDANGVGTWQTPSGGGGSADSTTFQTNFRTDTMRTRINTNIDAIASLYIPIAGRTYTTTTGSGLALASSTVTTGNLMSLTNTGTAAASNTKNVLAIASSGANATTTQTVTGQTISVTNTGTSSTNIGLNVSASGASTNYAIYSAIGSVVFAGGSVSNSSANDVSIGSSALHGSTGGGGSGNRLVMCNGSGDVDFRTHSSFKLLYSFGTNITSGGAPTVLANMTAGGLSIGNTTVAVNASALIDMTSTTKGFLPPRMTATQGSAIASPAEGLLIYVTNTNGTFTAKGWWGYDGAAWQKLNN